jgi:hypothetical protein
VRLRTPDLGGGLIRHSGTELDGDGFFRDIELDDATGFTVQAGWRWVGLHYTRIEYENNFIREVDASHVGLRFNFKF